MKWRVHRACILLELLDDEDDNKIRAEGIEIFGPGAEADVAFDHQFSYNPDQGLLTPTRLGFYAVAVRGKGRMFSIDGEWPGPQLPERTE